jgi:hypothetical protein
MLNECDECHQQFIGDGTLCYECESIRKQQRNAAGDAERVFRERQAHAAGVE